MPTLRSKASKFFKRDGSSDHDPGSSQKTASNDGWQAASPSTCHDKTQSGPFNDEFNMFSSASDSEDTVTSNIPLNSNGSGKKGHLKKKSSLFSLFQRNKDEGVPPVPPLPPTLPHPFADGHISMGENSALNTALSDLFKPPVPHPYPTFPSAPPYPPPPPPTSYSGLDHNNAHAGGSKARPSSPSRVTPRNSHARHPSAPTVPTAPAAPMTPNTFATFRFAPSPSPSPLKLKPGDAGSPPARPHRPSNSIVKSSLYVSALFSGMPLSPEADQLTFKPQDTDAGHGQRPATAHPTMSTTPGRQNKDSFGSVSTGSTRSAPRITSLKDINLPAALADLKNLPGEVTPSTTPEPLSALTRYSSSTTSSGSYYSQVSVRGRVRIPSVQQAQAAQRAASRGASQAQPQPLGLSMSLRTQRRTRSFTVNTSRSASHSKSDAEPHAVPLPPGRVQVQVQDQKQRHKKSRNENENENRDTHASQPPIPSHVQTALSSTSSRYSDAGMAVPMGPLPYPLSHEIPMEQFDPSRGEFHFVRHSLGKDGKSPGALWRDDQGFLHWVADI